MVNSHKTPSQHNSTLYISPIIHTRRPDLFVTPPNPPNTVFDTPGSNHSLFFDHLYKILGQARGAMANVNHNGGLGDPTESTRTTNTSQPQAFNEHGLEAAETAMTQADKLRLWRHDALMQHQYKAAEYIGDKVLALTHDSNDAFWLAQVYFDTGNYLRAKDLLSRYDKSVSCRYLAAYSLIKLEMWDDALDLVGEINPFVRDDFYQVRNSDGGIKLEASMCYLRGLIYANQSNFEKAKESYKEAVLIDVKCYDAFHELISNNLMTPLEEWDFVMSLNYRNADDDNSDLIKLLYTTNLSKYMNIGALMEAEEILDEEYKMGDNCDILLSRADFLYTQCKFDESLQVCERVLEKDQFNFDIVPIYLSCLYELGSKNKLFLKAHQLAENHSTNAVTWLAIGVYYLSINKVIESRKFFSKATLLSPNFGQAWIGFAHTFAAEGEHEQAVSAYAFAARLFPGTHLPNLFLGMQHLQMSNLNLLEEYLLAAYQICSTDPLLLNELGVINYHKHKLRQAETYCREALAAAKYLNSDSKTWISIHANLGHIYRRDNQPHKALECFQQVLKISNRDDCNILAAMGIIFLKLGDYLKAIDIFHDALAMSPADPVASDLLKRALEANIDNSARFLKTTSAKLFESNMPILRYQKVNAATAGCAASQVTTAGPGRDAHVSTSFHLGLVAGNHKPATPIKESNSKDHNGESVPQAEDLLRGEDSSDEEAEIMDIESD